MTALVLIPGLASDGWIWQHQARDLADIAAVTIGDTLHDDSIAGMAERILAAAPERFALGAISMGGYVAFEIMRIAPQRVERVALFDTSPHLDTPDQVQQRRDTIALIRGVADYAGLTRRGGRWMLHDTSPDTLSNALGDMALRIGADTYVRQIEAVLARRDPSPVLATILVPTLVAVGEADRVTPPAASRAIAAAIPGARLEVIAGAGHLPPIEQPDATTALLREWLSE